jgi:hypothetical protein
VSTVATLPVKKKLMLLALATVVLNSLSCSTEPATAQTAEVFRNSGLKQCGDEKPAPETFARLLETNGVKVRASGCATDGSLRAQVCDLDRGLLYVYEIDAAGLAKALSLGFSDVKPISANPGYRKFACNASLIAKRTSRNRVDVAGALRYRTNV